MRDETRYPHRAREDAATATRQALAAGHDVLLVSADNAASWAAAHQALETSTETGTRAAAPRVLEIGGLLGSDGEPVLATVGLWFAMIEQARGLTHPTQADVDAIDDAMAAHDEGDLGAAHAAGMLRAAGTRTVLWLHGDHITGSPPPPGARELIETITRPLRAAEIQSVICLEGMARNGWGDGRAACSDGAQAVHLPRYAGPLDSHGRERSDQAMAEDLDDVRRLVEAVAKGEGTRVHGTLDEDEAAFLCDGSAGCARELIGWTQRAHRVAEERPLAFADFIRTRPDDERTSALHRCAEGAERTMRELRGNG